ncbi:MAG: hypothetical protein DRQ47_11190 [Gammaproteobacteria bacterium]|nr:MAG: hypothetical protein DRQ47_11190 [Gammaproteobacteria bacterium]
MLTVTSSDNQTATSSQEVEVYILPSAEYTTRTSNLTATFTNNTSGGDGDFTYEWDFGDEGTSTEDSPSHTYSMAGSYTVVLTATDGQSNISTFSSSVTVSDPPPPASSGGGGGSMGLLLLAGLMLLSRFGATRQKG